ncbi:MAG: hypothetical protein AB4038_21475 [Prochloraceae cyanobacterium]
MSNGHSSDRLDRIEAIVESNARAIRAMSEQQATDRAADNLKHQELTSIVESNSRAIRAMSEQQATDRAADKLKHQELTAIVESNSRAIQAMMEQQTTDRLNHEEKMASLAENLRETRQLMARVAETQSGLTKILINHDEDRPTIQRRLMVIENKVDQILEQNQE